MYLQIKADISESVSAKLMNFDSFELQQDRKVNRFLNQLRKYNINAKI